MVIHIGVRVSSIRSFRPSQRLSALSELDVDSFIKLGVLIHTCLYCLDTWGFGLFTFSRLGILTIFWSTFLRLLLRSSRSFLSVIPRQQGASGCLLWALCGRTGLFHCCVFHDLDGTYPRCHFCAPALSLNISNADLFGAGVLLLSYLRSHWPNIRPDTRWDSSTILPVPLAREFVGCGALIITDEFYGFHCTVSNVRIHLGLSLGCHGPGPLAVPPLGGRPLLVSLLLDSFLLL